MPKSTHYMMVKQNTNRLGIVNEGSLYTTPPGGNNFSLLLLSRNLCMATWLWGRGSLVGKSAQQIKATLLTTRPAEGACCTHQPRRRVSNSSNSALAFARASGSTRPLSTSACTRAMSSEISLTLAFAISFASLKPVSFCDRFTT